MLPTMAPEVQHSLSYIQDKGVIATLKDNTGSFPGILIREAHIKAINNSFNMSSYLEF